MFAVESSDKFVGKLNRFYQLDIESQFLIMNFHRIYVKRYVTDCTNEFDSTSLTNSHAISP